MTQILLLMSNTTWKTQTHIHFFNKKWAHANYLKAPNEKITKWCVIYTYLPRISSAFVWGEKNPSCVIMCTMHNAPILRRTLSSNVKMVKSFWNPRPRSVQYSAHLSSHYITFIYCKWGVSTMNSSNRT